MDRLEEIKAKLKELGERLPEVKTSEERHEIMNQIAKLMEEKILIEKGMI